MDNLLKSNVKGLSKMQWLHVKKEHPFKLFYKEVYNTDLPFEEIDFSKKGGLRGRPPTTILLPPLYERPPKIKAAKYNNLMQLLPYIPPIHHAFYESLNPGPGTLAETNNTGDDEAETFRDMIESDNE